MTLTLPSPLITLTSFGLAVLVLAYLFSTAWTHHRLDAASVLKPRFRPSIATDLPTGRMTISRNTSELFDAGHETIENPYIRPLLECAVEANQITGAVRLPHTIFNISLASPDSSHDPANQHFNPTFIPLPPHSPYPYLLLSRLVTEGLHQESHVCFASICLPHNSTDPESLLPPDTQHCSASDTDVLGDNGGMRCTTAPQRLNIPPTAARRCEGAWVAFPDIPGFHDPRVFWSGKGEPLIMVNSASPYACLGLWIIDLRAVYPELQELMERKGQYAAGSRQGDMALDLPARMSYPYLTELTRNPRQSRGAVEKNWILFFPNHDESWIQYDIVAHGSRGTTGSSDRAPANISRDLNRESDIAASLNTNNSTADVHHESHLSDTVVVGELGFNLTAIMLKSDTKSNASRRETSQEPNGAVDDEMITLTPARTLAKLIGSGYSTNNLTSVTERACLTPTDLSDREGNQGHWHQGSNSLRLILCTRNNLTCIDNNDKGKVAHFAILHRKFSNNLGLPMRYERYVMVWDARFPFRMIGISRSPFLFAGERAQPWTEAENGLHNDATTKRWAAVYFTYTPSIAWAWKRRNAMDDDKLMKHSSGTGYLDDDVLVGIGMDDAMQGFVKLKAAELLMCLRLCPDFETVATGNTSR